MATSCKESRGSKQDVLPMMMMMMMMLMMMLHCKVME
jgi:hypothetical protein